MIKTMSFLIFFSLSVISSNVTANTTNINWQKVISHWQALAQQQQAVYQIPGWSAAIVVNNQQIFANGYGIRALNDKASVNANTLFQIASLSKAFTVGLMAQEIDRGNITWSSRITDFLPGFQFYDSYATKNATITDIFSQRSGLKTYLGDMQANLGFSRNHIIESFRYFRPIAAFRSQYNYQNCLFLVGAKIEENLSGLSWEKEVRERLFIPLEMNNSSASRWGYNNVKNKVGLHSLDENGTVKQLTDNGYIDWVYILAPAAGINSTVNDMSKWMIMQLNHGIYNSNQIISAESIKAMHLPQISMGKTLMGQDSYYCMGWILSKQEPYDIIWHNGGSSGNSATILLIPELNAGIVILANINGHFPYLLAREFYDIIIGRDTNLAEKELYGQSNEINYSADNYDYNIPASLPLSSYAGHYVNKVYGPIDLYYDSNRGLYGSWGANKTPIQLYHLSGDTFALSCQLAYPVYEPITFEINNETISGLSVKCFHDEGVDFFTLQ